jgi:hypothetical protein
MTDVGNYLREAAEAHGLNLQAFQRHPGKDAFFIKFGRGQIETELSLTGPILQALLRDRALQEQCATYLRELRQRSDNTSLNHFQCKNGAPLHLDFLWPIERTAGHDRQFLHTTATNLSNGTISRCSLIITYWNRLSAEPFTITQRLTNRVREIIDNSDVPFYLPDEHPSEVKTINLEAPISPAYPDLQGFLRTKVYWLGFKQGGKQTKVWVADPWDATYLGCTTRDLIQAAELLEAEEQLELEGECACVSRLLLRSNAQFEGKAGTATDLVAQRPAWDVFICHASEDKTSFVEPLAQALRQRGLRVWYDKWTLRIGDSLRRKIDAGLASSKYGIVVLSHAFFGKEWPQKELDGLDSLESNGHKVILPVWHGIGRQEVVNYSPLLAGRLASTSAKGVPHVVEEILAAMEEKSEASTPTQPQVAHHTDPTEYWQQRKLLPDTPLYHSIAGQAHWRIWIRSTEFKPARFRDIEGCRSFISTESLPAGRRLYPYPCANHATMVAGSDWLSGEGEIKDVQLTHLERWILFRSGQFVHYVGLDFIPQLGDRLHVLEILDLCTASMEFASRMATRGVLSPAAAISIELFGVAGRRLTWPRSVVDYQNLAEFSGWCQDEHLLIERHFGQAVLQDQKRSLGLELALEFYAKFGWDNPPRPQLLEQQALRFG